MSWEVKLIIEDRPPKYEEAERYILRNKLTSSCRKLHNTFLNDLYDNVGVRQSRDNNLYKDCVTITSYTVEEIPEPLCKCPCGAEAVIVGPLLIEPDEDNYWVRCSKHCGMRTVCCDTKKKAYDIWNCRA